MNKRKSNMFRKKINKYYHLYGFRYQHLYINTEEVMDDKSCSLDVHLWDEKKKEYGPWMFMVQNYNAFQDSDFVPYYSYMKDHKILHTFDGVKISYTPFYDDWSYDVPMFTFPKFTAITKGDIERCMKYFCKVILGDFWIWNISFGTEEEDRNQLEFGFKEGINEK